MTVFALSQNYYSIPVVYRRNTDNFYIFKPTQAEVPRMVRELAYGSHKFGRILRTLDPAKHEFVTVDLKGTDLKYRKGLSEKIKI